VNREPSPRRHILEPMATAQTSSIYPPAGKLAQLSPPISTQRCSLPRCPRFTVTANQCGFSNALQICEMVQEVEIHSCCQTRFTSWPTIHAMQLCCGRSGHVGRWKHGSLLVFRGYSLAAQRVPADRVSEAWATTAVNSRERAAQCPLFALRSDISRGPKGDIRLTSSRLSSKRTLGQGYSCR
jgi:hypothetical protein